jgi:hypothetical protein
MPEGALKAHCLAVALFDFMEKSVRHILPG